MAILIDLSLSSVDRIHSGAYAVGKVSIHDVLDAKFVVQAINAKRVYDNPVKLCIYNRRKEKNGAVGSG